MHGGFASHTRPSDIPVPKEMGRPTVTPACLRCQRRRPGWRYARLTAISIHRWRLRRTISTAFDCACRFGSLPYLSSDGLALLKFAPPDYRVPICGQLTSSLVESAIALRRLEAGRSSRMNSPSDIVYRRRGNTENNSGDVCQACRRCLPHTRVARRSARPESRAGRRSASGRDVHARRIASIADFCWSRLHAGRQRVRLRRG